MEIGNHWSIKGRDKTYFTIFERLHWKLDREKSGKKIAGEDKEQVEGPGKMCWF